jgi:hypothetical protein
MGWVVLQGKEHMAKVKPTKAAVAILIFIFMGLAPDAVLAVSAQEYMKSAGVPICCSYPRDLIRRAGRGHAGAD